MEPGIRQHGDEGARRCPRTGRIVGEKKSRGVWILPLSGAAALVWFLARVIPKPSRAAYPCQRAALPAAAGFVIWAASALGAVGAWRAARAHRRGLRRGLAAACAAAALLAGVFSYLNLPAPHAQATFTPTDAPNSPLGKAFGIKPGRVVWTRDPGAATWNFEGAWWEDRHTDPKAVERMLVNSIHSVADAASDAEAWTKLFTDFNTRRGRGARDYQKGEKIAIKVNLNQVASYESPREGASVTAPQLLVALLGQLVHQAGVDASDITIYDATRYVPALIFERCGKAFPGVRFVDFAGGEGRTQYRRDPQAPVRWSQPLEDGVPTWLPTCVGEADYLINIAGLKAHSLAGVTLTAKNHLGSLCCDGADGKPTVNSGRQMHAYIGAGGRTPRPMGSYNPLVDLMGHKDLGGKTLLYIIDGLYGVQMHNAQLEAKSKWETFGGAWTASLFVSQDGVAVDSVAMDFMRCEPTMTLVTGNADNYLHEAAQADAPPSKSKYDPEGDGTVLASLGVHEHWNNAKDRQYSRNLGKDAGIELVKMEDD